MDTDLKALRLLGIYAQAQQGRFMVRIKVPGGTFSAEQALALCEIGDRFSSGTLHLTTRMSIELHGVAEAEIPEALGQINAAGLTTRGACGGAVRGVAVSSVTAPENERARELARSIHTHFAGNARFEGLPKKFKVGVDAGYATSRHLIQDVGLVLGEDARCDVWLAGGLGRAPRASFLFASGVPEGDVLALIEGVVRVYKTNAPLGKRLKHVVAEVGEDGLRDLLRADLGARYPEGRVGAPAKSPRALAVRDPEAWLTAPVFAGELSTRSLSSAAAIASEHARGELTLTPDQDLALRLAPGADRSAAARALEEAGLGRNRAEAQAVFRVCPGSHECHLGLAPTRDIARQLIDVMGPAAKALTWAISGCPNSCAQPQLAEVGIVATRLRSEGSRKVPLFDLLRKTDEGLGSPVLQKATLEEVAAALTTLG